MRISQFLQLLGQESGRGMNPSGDVTQPLRSMIYGVESGHGSQQRLSRTDIGRSLLTFDMLLAGLQSQAISRMAVSVLGDTDDTSRDRTFIIVLRSEESGGRTPVEHRDTEALAATEYDIRSPFSRRSQQYQAHQVGGYAYLGSGGARTGHEFLIVLDRTIRVRELYDGGEHVRRELEFLIIAHYHLDALRDHAGVDDGQRRGEHVLVNEYRIGFRFHLRTAA